MFKIVELEFFLFFLKQKLIIDSVILNKWKFFSGMVDKWRGLPEDCMISPPTSNIYERKEEWNYQWMVIPYIPWLCTLTKIVSPLSTRMVGLEKFSFAQSSCCIVFYNLSPSTSFPNARMEKKSLEDVQISMNINHKTLFWTP